MVCAYFRQHVEVKGGGRMGLKKRLTSLGWRICQFLVGLGLGYHLPTLLMPQNSTIVPGPSSPPVTSLKAPLLPLVVGVMTAGPYLNNRACSVWRTWGQDVLQAGGEIRFFVGEKVQGGEWCGLPLVALEGVRDADYPPQRKSFLMLAWLARHLGDRTRWILRSDDDVYVKVPQLLEFLAPLDHREPLYIGQAGRGRGVEEGKLGLGWHHNFCMGGPGVLLSSEALRLTAPLLPTCLASLVTQHEDVELGRCVTRATGQTCTWAYDMQTKFYHSTSAEEERGSEVVPNTVAERTLDHAITIHPLKRRGNMEGLALRMAARKHTAFQTEVLKAKRLASLIQAEDPVDLGSAAMSELATISGSWDLILSHQLYSLGAGGAKRKVPAHLAEGVTRAVSHVLDVINKEASAKGRIIEFRDLFYAYVKYDPQHGITYILDLLLLYKRFKGSKMTVKVRRHVYLRQALLPAVLRVEEGDETTPPSIPALVSGDGQLAKSKDNRPFVHLLVPIAGAAKLEVLARFLNNYEREVLQQLQPASLVMVVFAEAEDDPVERAVREGMESLEINYPGYSFDVVTLRAPFSRAVGLMAGVAERKDTDLLLLLDIDIKFTAAAFSTIRMFTKAGSSVFFPIVFSQFKDKGGYWRDFGFGIVSVYKSDLLAVKGLNTNIAGWGKEDVDLYDRFLNSNLTVERAVAPELVHLYHPVSCSKDLASDQAGMCATSRASTFMSLPALVDTVLNSSLLIV